MPEEDPAIAFDGGSPRTRKQILYQLNDRLKLEPGVEHTRFEPGRITPDTVVASIRPTTFIGETYPARTATLEVWWSPRSDGNDHFTIQWYEAPDRKLDFENGDPIDPTLPDGYTLSFGCHQDDHFDELGEAHYQEEYPDGSTKRYGVTFEDATPRWILSTILRELPDRLTTFRERLDATQDECPDTRTDSGAEHPGSPGGDDS